ncbi:hypothetical protein ACRTEV_16600 [Rossellomorea arthrocnemi]
MANPSSSLIELTEEGIQESSLEETSLYKIMKLFLDDRERLIYHLLKGEG